MIHTAESTHWYTREGKPAYTVKAKAGHDRPTTLADARKIGLVPSVTTIIRCADRPGLTNWMIDQAILAALTLPRGDGELEKDWLIRVKQDSKEQARKAAERGTAIHAAIQGSYEDETPDPDFWPFVKAASDAVKGWQDDPELNGWLAEQSFSHSMGFGGKCDLSCYGYVLDFKTKEFGPEDKLQAWDEHAMQLAAYRAGLENDEARCAICYVSTTNPGLARLIEIPENNLVRGWKCFYSLLQFWKAKNGFESAFERLAA